MLKRSIRKPEMLLLMINGIIGAGIFGLPAQAFRQVGTWSLPGFLVCAIAIYFIILCFAEVSSRFDRTGGPYVYAMESFGPFPAFMTGWLLLLSRFLTYAALINLFVTYLTVVSDWFSSTTGRTITIVSVTLVLGLINHIGIRNTTRVNNILAIAKTTALLVFIMVGIFFVRLSDFPVSESPTFIAFSQTVLLLVFSFGGFESVLVNSGEVQNPQKNLPFALLMAPLIITILYLCIQFVCIGTLPGLADSKKPLAEAAEGFMGRGGSVFITVGALVSIAGTLNSVMLAGSRIPFAISTEKQFPSVFSFVHPRYHTPTWSLLLFLTLTTALSLFHSFVEAATISAITRVIIYMVVCMALIRLRKKYPDTRAPFHVKSGTVVAIAGVILSLWLLSGSPLKNISDILIALVTGLVIFLAFRRKN